MYELGDQGLSATFNMELTRAVRYFPQRHEAAARLVDLHVRQAQIVQDVLRRQINLNADKMLQGTLDDSCLLALVLGKQHLQTTWKRYAAQITRQLRRGLPIACKSEKPKTEPRLQEICDGILQAQDSTLEREYPFMRWASTKTKPDWSAEQLLLWIELKYVRAARDLHPISEAISSDITKYGDNNRRVLFLVYDPHTHLPPVEEVKFAGPIRGRENMMIEFIR